MEYHKKSQGFPERRANPRQEFSINSLIFSLSLSEGLIPDRPFRIEAKNISLGGLKFLSNRKIPLFQELYVQIYAKDSKAEPAKIPARVTRVEEIDVGLQEKTYGIAVKFIVEDPKVITHLQTLLK